MVVSICISYPKWDSFLYYYLWHNESKWRKFRPFNQNMYWVYCDDWSIFLVGRDSTDCSIYCLIDCFDYWIHRVLWTLHSSEIHYLWKKENQQENYVTRNSSYRTDLNSFRICKFVLHKENFLRRLRNYEQQLQTTPLQFWKGKKSWIYFILWKTHPSIQWIPKEIYKLSTSYIEMRWKFHLWSRQSWCDDQ